MQRPGLPGRVLCPRIHVAPQGVWVINLDYSVLAPLEIRRLEVAVGELAPKIPASVVACQFCYLDLLLLPSFKASARQQLRFLLHHTKRSCPKRSCPVSVSGDPPSFVQTSSYGALQTPSKGLSQLPPYFQPPDPSTPVQVFSARNHRAAGHAAAHGTLNESVRGRRPRPPVMDSSLSRPWTLQTSTWLKLLKKKKEKKNALQGDLDSTYVLRYACTSPLSTSSSAPQTAPWGLAKEQWMPWSPTAAYFDC